MTENSIVRMITVLAVMIVVGFVSFPIQVSRLKKAGTEDAAARKQASLQAKKHSVIAGFLYMVFMVSLVQVFL